ncbi:Pfs1 [Kluyveromyces lactis]|nr:Pfs1 [Kluyveromyces lactis]
MEAMGTQKPLGVNSTILNKHIPTKSPTKRTRTRMTLERADVRNKGRIRYKTNVQDLNFLDSMDTSCDTGPQMIQLPSQSPYNQHFYQPNNSGNRNADVSFHSLPPEYEELQLQSQKQYQMQLQQHNYYSSSPVRHQPPEQQNAPQLPPRADNINTSMLVFNSSGFNNCSPHSSVPIVTGFPSYFNPRQAKNMPHGEKVERWMENLPIYFEESEQMTHTDCFNISDDSEFWEEDEFDNELDDGIALTNSVEIIFLQQRRITALINKLYH